MITPKYICPGCLYLGKKSPISLYKDVFICKECEELSSKDLDFKIIELVNQFKIHNKKGYRCPGCNKFIPHPLTYTEKIICPYIDCCFVGNLSLKKMNHPTYKLNLKDLKPIKPKLQTKNTSIIKETIIDEMNCLPYNGTNFTLIHKMNSYQSFLNLLDKFPSEMINYLLHNSRKGGFQSKIFQEYVRLLEISIPFCYKKGKSIYRVASLLDDNINIFNGISVFEAMVTDKLIIKNNTKEFYIGGRKASYVKPYYIGKILNIVNLDSKESILDNIVEYSFSKIKIKNIDPGTNVSVTHLRIPPHYQIGGMTYINRARNKILLKINNSPCS